MNTQRRGAFIVIDSLVGWKADLLIRYLRKWAPEFGVGELLDRLLEELNGVA